jgi:hypothetical protein
LNHLIIFIDFFPVFNYKVSGENIGNATGQRDNFNRPGTPTGLAPTVPAKNDLYCVFNADSEPLTAIRFSKKDNILCLQEKKQSSPF